MSKTLSEDQMILLRVFLLENIIDAGNELGKWETDIWRMPRRC